MSSSSAGLYLVTLDAALVLNGPHATDATECVLGRNCTVTVTGEGLSDTNGVAVVQDSQDCGPLAMATTFVGWEGRSTTGTTTFALGDPSSGTASPNMHLCWGHEPSVDNLAGFAIRIGAFAMAGAYLSDGWRSQSRTAGVAFDLEVMESARAHTSSSYI